MTEKDREQPGQRHTERHVEFCPHKKLVSNLSWVSTHGNISHKWWNARSFLQCRVAASEASLCSEGCWFKSDSVIKGEGKDIISVISYVFLGVQPNGCEAVHCWKRAQIWKNDQRCWGQHFIKNTIEPQPQNTAVSSSFKRQDASTSLAHYIGLSKVLTAVIPGSQIWNAALITSLSIGRICCRCASENSCKKHKLIPCDLGVRTT